MGALTVLGLVQEFAALRGLPIPAALVGAQDRGTAQLRAVLNEVLRKLQRYTWQEQKLKGTWLAAPTANQGQLVDIFPGYSSLVDTTGWAEDRKIPIIGPITDAEWAAQVALQISGPPFRFWLSQGSLYLTPNPVENEILSFIYITDYPILSGGFVVPTITSDDDTTLFPDDVVLKGLESRWKKQKGEGYADDEMEFLSLIAKAKSGDLPTLQLDSQARAAGPGIYIPIGNWPVSGGT